MQRLIRGLFNAAPHARLGTIANEKAAAWERRRPAGQWRGVLGRMAQVIFIGEIAEIAEFAEFHLIRKGPRSQRFSAPSALETPGLLDGFLGRRVVQC